jgi:tRNA nucleotidyltransferase (CCA-adding enzyme)
MKIYLVGGAVRDKLLGQPVQERDWVIVGATEADLRKLGYRQVGKEFPVFLHPKTHEEYALARMERKVRPGYQGFTFDTSPKVTLEDDLIRRDLTINAMAETEEGELIDPHHGKADLAAKLLRHVSPAFEEDPVRILRVGRFLARYAHLGFQVAPETITLMRTMVSKGEVDALVAERVWKELERALTEKHPEKFFEVLAACGALSRLFPQLDLTGCGREALLTATQLTPAPTVRFAALLHAVSLPEESIPALCARYRAPKIYRSLALLTATHYQTVLRAKTLSAEALLDFFSAVDIYRRADRFQEFMTAVQAIALASNQAFEIEWIKNKVRLVKSINVHAFTEKGLTGMTLAKALRAARLKEIENTG